MSSLVSRIHRLVRARFARRRDDGEIEGPDIDGPRPVEPARDPQLARWYANLEIPYGSSVEDAERAWKRLMRRYHPDLHAGDPDRLRTATELVQGLNEAYDGLRRRLEGGTRAG